MTLSGYGDVTALRPVQGNAVVVTELLMVKERAGCNRTRLRICAVYRERILLGVSFMVTVEPQKRAGNCVALCGSFTLVNRPSRPRGLSSQGPSFSCISVLLGDWIGLAPSRWSNQDTKPGLPDDPSQLFDLRFTVHVRKDILSLARSQQQPHKYPVVYSRSFPLSCTRRSTIVQTAG